MAILMQALPAYQVQRYLHQVLVSSPASIRGKKGWGGFIQLHAYLLYYLTLQVQSSGVVCESLSGRPGLPVPNSPYCLCGRKATVNLCESLSGRPGSPSLIVLMVSVDVKQQ